MAPWVAAARIEAAVKFLRGRLIMVVPFLKRVDVRFGSAADITRLLAMSALPLKADKARACWHVRFVPRATVSRCSELSYETGQWSIRGLRPKSKTAWGHPTYRA